MGVDKNGGSLVQVVLGSVEAEVDEGKD